jgi:hypothetical protein
MHVTEVGVGASDATASILPFAIAAAKENIDLLSHLLPYPATHTYTHIRHLRQDGLRQRQTTKVLLGLAY